MTQKLKNYIENERRSGKTDEQIRQVLTHTGWEEKVILDVMATDKSPEIPLPSTSEIRQLHPKAIWLFFIRHFWPVALLIFLFPGYFLNLNLLDDNFTNNPTIRFVALIGILLMLATFAAAYFWSLLEYKFYKFSLTDDFFKKESGVIYKKYVSIPYDRIQNIDIYRGLLHRILGLSDLHIQTAGGSGNSGYKTGIYSEANIPGISHDEAEALRSELMARIKNLRK